MFQFSILGVALFVNVFSVICFAKQSFLEISNRRHVAYEIEIFRPEEPTLVLLPGVYRGLNQDDIFIQKLMAKKQNFLALHFSTQPASIATLQGISDLQFSGSEKPFTDINSQELAQEIEFTIQSLKIQRPLIVSLSYSASVTEHLNSKLYPLVVDTAPMGRFDESDKDSVELLQFWQNWFQLFPIWGGAYAQTLKLNAYHSYWEKIARGYANKDSRLANPGAIELLTQGYVAMALAVEGFDLRKQNFLNSPKRIFIFGAKEDAARSLIQNEAVQVYQRVRSEKNPAITIQSAGHIIPNENPDEYIAVLQAIAKRVFKN